MDVEVDSFCMRILELCKYVRSIDILAGTSLNSLQCYRSDSIFLFIQTSVYFHTCALMHSKYQGVALAFEVLLLGLVFVPGSAFPSCALSRNEH